MNILIVIVLCVVFLLSYLGKITDLVRSWYPDGSYRYPIKEFGKIAAIVIVSNVVVALMTKTKLTAIIGLVLAVAYLLFIWAMIFTAKFTKQIRAAAGLVVPMTVNIVYCRVRFAEGNFDNQWRTVKAFIWYLVLPLILTLIIAVIRYCQLRGWFNSYRKRVRRERRTDDDYDEDEDYYDEEEEYDDDEDYDYDDDEPDDGEGRPSRAEEWLVKNWLLLLSLIAVVGTLIACTVIVLNTISS